MRKFFSILLCSVFASTYATASPLDVKELKLKNGMTVWLNEDHSQPKVFGAVVVKAGGVDTPNEGIAHYFEHIMFKGTDRLGTKDYAKEKPLLDSISCYYDKLANAETEAERAEIQKEINRLNIAAADYAIPNEFNRLINLYGGSALNAATSADITFYHNVFSPQYMHQWLELNSHRLINPVFRLFQGELETVYEEKNRYADNPMSGLSEDVLKWFGTSPYAYPVIGSTENLKNPQMSKMRKFYKTYYVANNMALILTGDFDSEEVEGLLEETFGRIPSGETPPQRASATAPHHSGETIQTNINIPLIKIFALVFDYPKNGHADEGATQIAMNLLSNDNKTGMLDNIMTEKKALGVAGQGISFDGAGITMILGIPNLFSSSKKLEKQIWSCIDALHTGSFSDETFELIRKNYISEQMRNLETISGRGNEMIMAWSRGKTWDEHISAIQNLQKISKEDVVAVSNKYLTKDNFMRLVKKYGQPKHDKLSQPGYKPIAPKKDNAESEYAKNLRRTIPVPKFTPKLIDLQNDAKKTQLSTFANLYTVKNPIDSLYELQITYYRGSKKDPMTAILADFLNEIGTDNKTRKELNEALLKANATMEISNTTNTFSFTLKGSDNKFHEALTLLSDMITNPKADKESFKIIIDNAKLEEKTFNTLNDVVCQSIINWLIFGDNSPSLNRVTKNELKKMKPEQLLNTLDSERKMQMAITYNGTLAHEEVEKAVRELLPVNTATEPADDTYLAPMNAPAIPEGTPVIYFYHMSGNRQALIGTYSNLPAINDERSRVIANTWGKYFGGGMSSVMFQELREYRSLCYSCNALIEYPHLNRHANDPGLLYMILGTQADKAITAIETLDELMQKMPLSEPNFEAIKATQLNSISHNFPSFRGIGTTIANYQAWSYNEDINAMTIRHLPDITLQDINDFHNNVIKTVPKAYIVIGDKKAINMKELAKHGTIIMLNDKDIFKK